VPHCFFQGSTCMSSKIPTTMALQQRLSLMASQYLFCRMSVKFLHGCTSTSGYVNVWIVLHYPNFFLPGVHHYPFRPPCCLVLFSHLAMPQNQCTVLWSKVYTARLLSSLSSFLQVFLKYTVRMHCLQKLVKHFMQSSRLH
jgi:hypothetical protein